MMGDRIKSKIYIKKNNQPSAFMVNLNEVARDKKSKEEILKKANANILEKTKERFNVKLNTKVIKATSDDKITGDKYFSEYEYKPIDQNLAEIHILDQQTFNNSFKEKVKSLALVRFFASIYFVFKQLFLLIEKICFQIGWVVVFLIRFFYYLFLRIAQVIITSLKGISALIFGGKINGNGIWQQHCIKAEPLITKGLMDLAISKIDESRNNGPVGGNFQEQKSIEIELGARASVHNSYTAINTINNRKKFAWPSSHFRFLKPALYFSLLLFVFVLPFKAMTYYSVLKDLGGRVLGASEEAIVDLKNAGMAANNLDFYKASEQFAAASDNFLKAQEEVNNISSQLKILGSIIPNHKLRLASDADNFLEAGKLSAAIGQQISFIFETFSSDKEKSVKTVFNAFYDNIDTLLIKTDLLNKELSGISADNLPDEHRDNFILLREKADQVNKSFFELSDLLKKMHIILGFQGEKRYMVVFQNNSEMRASGGFMGSFSIIDIKDGNIIKIDTPKGGTYDTEGALMEKIVAPEPLHLVNPLWHFWDANWWPDWRKTSKKLKWFYEKSGGSTVDGVIGITPVVAERLLEIIGPLDMEATHGVTINAENFWEITQTFSEDKPKNHPAYEPLPYFPKDPTIISTYTTESGKEPKKIIGDLIEVVKTELPKRLNKEIFLSLFASFEQSISEKHVLFYFDDWNVQSKFEELGWAGRTGRTAMDYLMIVNSNIGGAKSDRKIVQEINHSSEILDDGSIVNTIVVKRTHTSAKGEKFTGFKNMNWMRVYVPLGSQLIEAKGFWPPDESLFEKPDPSWNHDPDLINSEENYVRDRNSWTKIYNEDDKTVFANWAQVDPGESVELTLKYLLPFKFKLNSDDKNVTMPYSLLVEKQPGSESCHFSSKIFLPDNYIIDWVYPNNFKPSSLNWEIKSELREDKFWAITAKIK